MIVLARVGHLGPGLWNRALGYRDSRCRAVPGSVSIKLSRIEPGAPGPDHGPGVHERKFGQTSEILPSPDFNTS